MFLLYLGITLTAAYLLLNFWVLWSNYQGKTSPKENATTSWIYFPRDGYISRIGRLILYILVIAPFIGGAAVMAVEPNVKNVKAFGASLYVIVLCTYAAFGPFSIKRGRY